MAEKNFVSVTEGEMKMSQMVADVNWLVSLASSRCKNVDPLKKRFIEGS